MLCEQIDTDNSNKDEKNITQISHQLNQSASHSLSSSFNSELLVTHNRTQGGLVQKHPATPSSAHRIQGSRSVTALTSAPGPKCTPVQILCKATLGSKVSEL